MVKKESNSDNLKDDSLKIISSQYSETALFKWDLFMHSPVWHPPTDIFETEDAIVVRVEIAGMREENFSVELHGRYLSIRGSRQDVPERRAYHQMEIRFGEFNIELELSSPIDSNRVEAVYNAGFLRVTLPKTRPRQIRVYE